MSAEVMATIARFPILSGLTTAPIEVNTMPKKRFAIIGTGSRYRMFQADALTTTYAEHNELVASAYQSAFGCGQ